MFNESFICDILYVPTFSKIHPDSSDFVWPIQENYLGSDFRARLTRFLVEIRAWMISLIFSHLKILSLLFWVGNIQFHIKSLVSRVISAYESCANSISRGHATNRKAEITVRLKITWIMVYDLEIDCWNECKDMSDRILHVSYSLIRLLY